MINIQFNKNITAGKIFALPSQKVIIFTSAGLLFLLGSYVLFIWHHPDATVFYNEIIVMSYNTAICLAAAGIALLSLHQAWVHLLRSIAIFIMTLSCATLVELLFGFQLKVHYWFMHIFLNEIPTHPGFMSPTSATCFFLSSSSLLLLGLNLDLKKSRWVIPAGFLNLMTITIVIIALLGHGIGLIPAFVWLGIKMAIHTAIGIGILSLTIIFYIHQYAIGAFNRLNFFSRMITGFGFMAVLVICIGSVAFMQINVVSAITHELYQNPLQINNAEQRIRYEINTINRLLKNIAIKPDLIEYRQLPSQLDIAEKKIQEDISVIQKYEPSLKSDLDLLTTGFQQWEGFVLESYRLLNQQAFEKYADRTLYESQAQVLELEKTLDHINRQAQNRITELNKSVEQVEQDAKKLVLVIVCGFLFVGISVAFLITKSLTNQLQKLRLAMQDIAHEKMNRDIPFLDHTQEIGDMARTLQSFADSIFARHQLEKRLLQVIESMPNGFLMINQSGAIEIVNAQAEKIFGYNRTELLGEAVEKLIPEKMNNQHPYNRDVFFKNPSPRAMGGGRELFGLRGDGSEFPIEIGLAPVETEEGIKVLASIVDITERKKSELALSESLERLELTTRVNQIGVWEFNVDTGKLIWDETTFEIYGRKKEYFTANYSAWTQSIHPDDLKKTEELFNEAINMLTPFVCRFRIILPDGTIKHIHAKAKVERKTNNQLRILGTSIDITREEAAYAKLHNFEALRSAIVESSDDAIISKTPEGIITSWNSGAHNMFGYSAEEVLGKSINNLLFAPAQAKEEDELMVRVRAGNVVKHFETTCKRKDGQLINVSITLSPIKDAAGNVIGISAIKRDITEYTRAVKMLSERKKELEASNHDLAQSNKELETFAYVASHDLKSPLRGIFQLSTWIEEDIAANEYGNVNSHTDMLRNRIQRMEKLLDDLLVFYRAGKVEGSITIVDVNFMGSELFEIQNTKPGLHLKLGENLPVFSTLSVPFEQVVRNFLSNAIKHHDREEGTVTLTCKDINQDFFEFSICDDGPGIPEKFQQRIFGMFQTLKPRDETEGSGMGLALIRKLVETYGGKVTVKSEGRGCCFHFTWPKIIRRRGEND